MTADVCKFVDSIAASPMTRLDINDEVKWWVRSFNAPPPRLRRSVGQNAMRDGIFVSSSQYDARVVTIEIDLKTTTQDDNATELQKLARELDRADNFLMYQPTGATKPVFFRLYRSDMSQIEQLTGASAFRRPTIELLAEPFALGLRETLGPFTVNNDPAAGSNGCYFDVTGVIGDVAAPCVVTHDFLKGRITWGARRRGTPSSMVWLAQAESVTLGTDTTNPGGGPDAAMSGAGTNNFVRTSFATPTSATRLTWNLSAGAELRGTYRLFAVIRRSAAAVEIKVGATVVRNNLTVTLPTAATPLTSGRQMVNVGLVSFDSPERTGGLAQVSADNGATINMTASRTSGAETLDWDCLILVPADDQSFIFDADADTSVYAPAAIDSTSGSVYGTTATFGANTGNTLGSLSGSLPSLAPNVTNRFIVLLETGARPRTMNKTEARNLTLDYWPRYLFVRPSAT